MWAVLLLNFAINVYAINILPIIQVLGGIAHVAFFVMLIVPLVLLSPRSSADFVFTSVLSQGGWKNEAVAWCIGLLTVTYCFLGECG